MSSCMVLGDSLAVGVGATLPQCETAARVGISSSRYAATLLPGRACAGTVVISLGANDGTSFDTLETLRGLRRRIEAGRVVWMLPARPLAARQAIKAVAAEYRDRTVDTAPWAGRDGLHPAWPGYRAIGAAALAG